MHVRAMRERPRPIGQDAKGPRPTVQHDGEEGSRHSDATRSTKRKPTRAASASSRHRVSASECA